MKNDDMLALVDARVSECIVEQMLLGHQYVEPEALELAQMQLALHQLARARLEVDVYTEALTKSTPRVDGESIF
jgi:hypothetical protein